MRIQRFLYDAGAGAGAGAGSGGGAGGSQGSGAGAGAGAGAGVGGVGGGAADWRASLPDDLRSEPSLLTIADVPALAKSFVNSQKLIGNKRIVQPGPNSTPAEWDSVYNALGRPETFDKYPDAAVKPADGLTFDKAGMDKAKGVFHKLGLLPHQAKGILDFYIEGMNGSHTGMVQQMEQQKAQATESLRADWGDKYQVNVDIAKAAVKKFADPAALAELEAGLGNNPAMVKMFHSMGKALMEDRSSMPGGTLQAGSAAEASQRIEALQQDAEWMKAFTSRDHPQHQAAVDQMLELRRKLAPGKLEVTG